LVKEYNPIKVILYLKRNINEKKEIRKIVSEKKDYLMSGNYVFSNRGKQIASLRDEITLEFIENNAKHLLRESTNKIDIFKEQIRKIIDNLFRFKILNIYPALYQGSLIMITGKKKVKIFDLKQNYILTFFDDWGEYLKAKEIYYNFKQFFKIPEAQYQDDKLMMIEERINFVPYNMWESEQLNESFYNVTTNYNNYFISSYGKRELSPLPVKSLLKNIDKVQNEKLRIRLHYLIPKVNYNDNWSRLPLHGDLNSHNVLLRDKTYYYIDWEYSRDLIFFYDLINIMFVDAMTFNNYFLLNNFAEGNYDEQLSNIFKIFDIEYNPDKKLIHRIYDLTIEKRLAK